MEKQARPGQAGGSVEEKSEPRQFSVVLAPTATLAVQKEQQQQSKGCSGTIIIRHLHIRRYKEGGVHKQPLTQRRASRLSSVVLAVRATPCTLHLFRGRRLCRVVDFPSPITDIAGLPPTGLPSSPSTASPSSDILCVVMCRDGTAYALPIAEALETSRGGTGMHTEKVGNELKRSVGSNGGAATAADGLKEGPSSSSAAVGIFEDLAPTMLPSRGSFPRYQPPHSNGDSGRSCAGVGGSLGGIIIRAQKRWAVFNHLGATTVAAWGGGAAVVAVAAGIIDRSALYGLADDHGLEPKPTAGRRLCALGGLDGAAPTTSCIIWMQDSGGVCKGYPGGCGGASGDGKGFPLSSPVFKALFGVELARQGRAFPSPMQAVQPTEPQQPTDRNTKSGSENLQGPGSMVVLVGDVGGVVRWSPVHPHPGVPGGVLCRLGTAIVATLPQLDAESRAVGVLIVGANGAVQSLTPPTTPRRVSRKRARSGFEVDGRREGGGSGNGESTTTAQGCRPREAGVGLPPIYRRSLKIPFPVASACSAPGFLVHCHAGALFASPIPTSGGMEMDECGEEQWAFGDGSLNRNDTSAFHSRHRARNINQSDRFSRINPRENPEPFRPIRLPLPCDTVGVTVAPVPAEGEADTTTSDPCNPILRTLVISLSALGRLVGFMAPRFTEELEGWGLDTGKGGVRVGGSAGVERRVRCQLERLSSVGRKCAELTTESAELDREIHTLRGAAGFLPSLVLSNDPQHQRGDKNPNHDTSPPALGYSISMGPDVEETEFFYGGTGQAEALRVLLRVRLWAPEGHFARELPAVEVDEAGRWFIVTRVVAGRGGGSDVAVEEGWAWSTSSVAPMASLRQGWPWSSSVALTLPSARPVTATSWLQFHFSGEPGDGGCAGGTGDDSTGVCVELGSSHFDVLDWGVKIPSVPTNTAAVRRAAHGRGACFCGPDLAIAEIFEKTPSLKSGKLKVDSRGRPVVPAAQCSFHLRVASPYRSAGDVLALLVPVSSKALSARAGVDQNGSTSAEVAVRVAGQVAAVQASDCALALAAGAGAGTGDVKAIEIVVTCSHEAMTPLVRESLLSRARALAWRGDGEGGAGGGGENNRNVGAGVAAGVEVIAGGDAAARLVREIRPVGQAINDAADAARALGVARASDGPSVDNANDALALMGRLGEIYGALRREQEDVGFVL